MGTPREEFFQLWCYYESEDRWVTEGFFRTKSEAEQRVTELRDDPDTPHMPDWVVTEVYGWW